MTLEKPEAMTDALSEKLENYNVDVNLEEVGNSCKKIGDGIATVIGMKNAMAGELVELPNNVSGMVLNLNPDSVGIVLMGGETLIKEGDLVRRTGNIMDVPVGEALLGRVVSAIGAPIDGKGEIAYAVKTTLLNLLLMVLRIVNLLILRCKLVSNVSMLSSLSDVVSANLLSVTVAQAKLLLLLILLLTKKASVLSAFM